MAHICLWPNILPWHGMTAVALASDNRIKQMPACHSSIHSGQMVYIWIKWNPKEGWVDCQKSTWRRTAKEFDMNLRNLSLSHASPMDSFNPNPAREAHLQKQVSMRAADLTLPADCTAMVTKAPLIWLEVFFFIWIRISILSTPANRCAWLELSCGLGQVTFPQVTICDIDSYCKAVGRKKTLQTFFKSKCFT